MAEISTLCPHGVCVTCHSSTRFHGSGATETHYENQDCTKCHPHASGFQLDPQSCRVCHGKPPASGAHTRHKESDIGLTDCDACHQAVNSWTDNGHRNGRVDFADGERLNNTAACDTCHGNAAGSRRGQEHLAQQRPHHRLHGLPQQPEPGILDGNAAPAVDAHWSGSEHGQSVGLSGLPRS